MGRLGFNFLPLNKKEIDCECDTVFVESNGEESVLNQSKSKDDANKKRYYLFFISTLIFTCFCIVFVIPQLVDYYSERKDLSMNMDQKQTVMEILDREKLRKYQERLDVLEKFDTLQRNYKILQAKYEKAKEIYLEKLHASYMVDGISS